MQMKKMDALTEQKIKQIIEDVMYTPPKDKPNSKPFATKLPEGFNLDDQIKDGYLYEVSNDNMTLMTGSGGIRDMIKTCRNSGLSDEFIVGDIFIVAGTRRINIVDAIWTPINKD